MEIKINIVEIATKLAADKTTMLCMLNAIEEWDNSDSDTEFYTEQAQDIFNKQYDYFYNILNNNKL